MWILRVLGATLLTLYLAELGNGEPSPAVDLSSFPFVSLTTSQCAPPSGVAATEVWRDRRAQNRVHSAGGGPIHSEEPSPTDACQGGRQAAVPTSQGTQSGGPVYKVKQFVMSLFYKDTPVDHEEPQFPMDLLQYEDEVVLRFNWTSARDEAAFVAAAETLVLDVWNVRRDGDGDEANYGDVRLPRRRLRDFLRLLPKSMRKPTRWHEHVEDVQLAVLSTLRRSGDVVTPRRGFFDDFGTLAEITQWLSSHPSIAVSSIGTSGEGREIISASVGTGRKHIVITAGMVAREWASISALLYALDSLTTDRELLRKYTLHFVPVVNPDGYVYSWEEDRLWRKNRQTTAVGICSGLAVERSINWTETATTTTPCSEEFAGKGPLDALEARHVASFIDSTGAAAAIDITSYSQQVAYSPNSVDSKEFAAKIQSATERDYELIEEPWTGGVDSFQVRLPDIDHQGFLVAKKRIGELGSQVESIVRVILDLHSTEN